jgi:chemotaxis protein methyltransferase CheR
VATGETYFFRVPSHFKIIREIIVPEIINRHREDRKIRIWSAGCSTGEEAYSLAILLEEALPDSAFWDILILGTDINKEALDKAKKGVYGRWSFREVPIEVVKENFLHRDNKYIIKKKFKDMVTFKPLNLIENTYPSFLTDTAKMDLILCRNVTIYFNTEIIKQVIGRFYQSILEDGFLLVGPAEYSAEIYRDFVTRVFPDSIVYQKRTKPHPSTLPTGTEPSQLPSISLRKTDPDPVMAHLPQWNQTLKERFAEKRKAEKRETELFREAVHLLENGEWNYSIEKFTEVVKINPHNARAYFLLGRISAQQGNIADAISCLGKSLAEDPLMFEAYFLLALLRLEEGSINEAANLLKKVVYIDSHFVLAYYHLGNIYKKQGKTKLAKKMFHNVKELLADCNLNNKVIEGEDISVGQILNAIENGTNGLEGKNS